jgi:hypothetical protein
MEDLVINRTRRRQTVFVQVSSAASGVDPAQTLVVVYLFVQPNVPNHAASKIRGSEVEALQDFYPEHLQIIVRDAVLRCHVSA